MSFVQIAGTKRLAATSQIWHQIAALGVHIVDARRGNPEWHTLKPQLDNDPSGLQSRVRRFDSDPRLQHSHRNAGHSGRDGGGAVG